MNLDTASAPLSPRTATLVLQTTNETAELSITAPSSPIAPTATATHSTRSPNASPVLATIVTARPATTRLALLVFLATLAMPPPDVCL